MKVSETCIFSSIRPFWIVQSSFFLLFHNPPIKIFYQHFLCYVWCKNWNAFLDCKLVLGKFEEWIEDKKRGRKKNRWYTFCKVNMRKKIWDHGVMWNWRHEIHTNFFENKQKSLKQILLLNSINLIKTSFRKNKKKYNNSPMSL